MVVNSVTRVGYFRKILATNFLAKVSQIFGDFLGYLENTAFEEITVMATFWATLQKNLALFIPTSGHTGREFKGFKSK